MRTSISKLRLVLLISVLFFVCACRFALSGGESGCRSGSRWHRLWSDLLPGKIILADDPTY